MIKWIKRSYAEFPDDLASMSRKRVGQKGGGGNEYYWCFFDELLWDMLDKTVIERSRDGLQRQICPIPTYFKHKPTLVLDPPKGVFAEELLALAGLNLVEATFNPFELRKAARCYIRFGNRKYFSRDLTPYHAVEVCVTSTAAAPDLIWVCEYDKRGAKVQGAGKYVCIADATANRAPYVPLEYQQEAEARRADGHRRRLIRRQEEFPSVTQADTSIRAGVGGVIEQN